MGCGPLGYALLEEAPSVQSRSSQGQAQEAERAAPHAPCTHTPRRCGRVGSGRRAGRSPWSSLRRRQCLSQGEEDEAALAGSEFPDSWRQSAIKLTRAGGEPSRPGGAGLPCAPSSPGPLPTCVLVGARVAPRRLFARVCMRAQAPVVSSPLRAGRHLRMAQGTSWVCLSLRRPGTGRGVRRAPVPRRALPASGAGRCTGAPGPGLGQARQRAPCLDHRRLVPKEPPKGPTAGCTAPSTVSIRKRCQASRGGPAPQQRSTDRRTFSS